MVQIPLDSIIARVLKSTSLSKPEFLKLVEKKKVEMKGLVSDEGAAYIVANDLGVKFLPDNVDDFLPVENIVPGLKHVNFKARVVQVFPVRQFESKGRKGSVANLVVGDGSGSVRLVLWNDLTKFLSEPGLSVNDIIIVKDAFSKQGMRGVEVHLSGRSRLAVNPEGVDVAAVKPVSVSEKKPVGEAFVGSVTHIFDRIYFFDICPDCRRRVKDGSCQSHGSVESVKNLVLSLNVDNGSEVIRAVLFGDAVQSVSGYSASDVHALFSSTGSFDDFLNELRSLLLGNLVRISGKPQVNDFTGRKEMVVNGVENSLNPELLISEILD